MAAFSYGRSGCFGNASASTLLFRRTLWYFVAIHDIFAFFVVDIFTFLFFDPVADYALDGKADRFDGAHFLWHRIADVPHVKDAKLVVFHTVTRIFRAMRVAHGTVGYATTTLWPGTRCVTPCTAHLRLWPLTKRYTYRCRPASPCSFLR